MNYSVKGFNPATLIDWEGKLSCVIYLPGCNFRCRFCHSADLVLNPQSLPDISFERIERFLEGKNGWIDAVIIGGGEPTLFASLPELALRIRKRRFLIKLDTNGTNPRMLKELLEQGLIDYAAIDIKAPLEHDRYNEITASTADLEAVRESIGLLMRSSVEYEFRTTVVPQFHRRQDILAVARQINGAKKFVLQQMSPKETLDAETGKVRPYPAEELKTMAALAKEFVRECFVRGI